MPILRTCFGITALVLLASGVLAGSLTLKVDVPANGVRLEAVGAYHSVQIKDGLFPSWDPPGAPRLPVLTVNVLLPVGAKASSVSVVCDDVLLASGLTLYPVQPARAFSDTNVPAFVPPDPRWYALDTPIPANRALLSGTHKMRGQSIAFIALSPVQFTPSRGEVSVARRMTLTVNYDEAVTVQKTAASGPEFSPRDHAFDDDVAGLVVNPEALATQNAGPPTVMADNPRDYLIITEGSAMVDAFWRLGMYRAANDGFTTTIKSISGINASYPGKDTQERIRNCIKDYVNNHGTIYVVLGGDDTVVPDRDVHAVVGDTLDDHIPADAYYSNLDGDWNFNGNKVYGELGDDVDFGVDVWVGRIPVRTAAEASNYVAKLIGFEKTALGHSGNMLVGGVQAWDTYTGTNRPTDTVSDGLAGFQGHDPVSDVEMWTRRLYRDEIQGNGFTPAKFGFYADTLTVQDANWAGQYSISGPALVGLLKENWFHVFYGGHGSPAHIAAETANFDVTAINSCRSPPVGIFYSFTCLAGAFDDPVSEPCLSEALLRHTRGGALAYVGSSRNGWGQFDRPPAENSSQGGASFVFARQFYRQVFSIQRTRLGSAFGNHKTALSGMVGATDTAYRWLEFSINLQGDPAMPLPSLADVNPPSPDPVSFAQPIEALNSTSIRLTSTPVTDVSGVEYQFAETAGRCPPSAWNTNRIQVITGLTPNTFYGFTVQARDRSSNHNLTGISEEATVRTPLHDGDLTAPTPNRMTFSSPPTAINSTTVVMTASTATDPSGVEYCFYELSENPGGTSSDWQTSPSFTDTDLLPGTQYIYAVTARDQSPNHNETTLSILYFITMPGIDAWDPADDTGTAATVLSAPLLTIQTHGPHTLSTTDRADWYRVWLSAGSSNTFSTPGGTGDNYGELFSDPQGTNLVAFNDDGAAGGQFKLTYMPSVTTSFYLRVRAFWPGDDCSYTLQWVGSAVDPNPPYPDPMRFSILPYTLSPSGVTMTAETATDNNGVEYIFEETTGHTGGESGAWQDGTAFSNLNLQPETVYGYRVRARDKSARQNLTDWSEVRQVTTPPVVPHDAWDPTDDAGTAATAISSPTPNEQTHGRHTLNGTDYEDWFAVYLEAGTTNRFRSVSEMGDPVAYLSRQPDGNELYAWDDDSGGDGNFAVQFAPPVSGTYYLRVIVYASSGPCIYDLAWQRGATLADMTLSDALDTEGEVWGTHGDTSWVPQIEDSHDGQDAARAGAITDGQTSVLFKAVTGPGDVGFWWRASSELNYDTLSFAVDGITNSVISGDTGWQYYLQAVGGGAHSLEWTFVKDVSLSNYLDSAFVDQFSFTPDGQPLPLFRSGSADWYSQPHVTHDGIAAEQSGLVQSNQWTRLQTFVRGPGTLTYWCKVSSEANYDMLHMSVDGRTNLSLSGEQDWQVRTVTVWRVGPRDISWVYQKDASVDDGLDAAWVDDILWTPIPLDRDTDGDGQFDWQEGVAGVNPFDSNSLFRLEVPAGGYRTAEGGFMLEWQSSTGIFYAVEHADTLNGGFYQIQTQIPGEAGRTRYDCGSTGEPFDFYRVRVDE